MHASMYTIHATNTNWNTCNIPGKVINGTIIIIELNAISESIAISQSQLLYMFCTLLLLRNKLPKSERSLLGLVIVLITVCDNRSV